MLALKIRSQVPRATFQLQLRARTFTRLAFKLKVGSQYQSGTQSYNSHQQDTQARSDHRSLGTLHWTKSYWRPDCQPLTWRTGQWTGSQKLGSSSHRSILRFLTDLTKGTNFEKMWRTFEKEVGNFLEYASLCLLSNIKVYYLSIKSFLGLWDYDPGGQSTLFFSGCTDTKTLLNQLSVCKIGIRSAPSLRK